MPPKRVVWNESEPNVQTFVKGNPATVQGSTPHNYAPADEKENAQVVQKRIVGRALSPERCARLSNTQQAFSPFAIPFAVDTEWLSVKELRVELAARGLPVSGTKPELRKRLEADAKKEKKGSAESAPAKAAKKPRTK